MDSGQRRLPDAGGEVGDELVNEGADVLGVGHGGIGVGRDAVFKKPPRKVTEFLGRAYDGGQDGTCAMLARIASTTSVALIAAGTVSGQWLTTEEAKLVAAAPADNDEFGHSVSISGDTAVVGAPRDSNSGKFEAGSVYVFVHNGTSWDLQAQLTASDKGNEDHFGGAVNISGNTIVVGAQDDNLGGGLFDAGSAYVFVRNGTSWTEQAKLIASDAEPAEQFANSISIWGDTVVVGNRYDDHSGIFAAGAAYVFVRSGTTWNEQAKLTTGAAQEFDLFGSSVSVWGDTILVGSPNDDAGGQNAGAAYVFVRSGTNWVEQTKLTAGVSFGLGVGVSNETVVVGASGSAYVFERSGASWTQTANLIPSDAEPGEYFGSPVFILDNTIVAASKTDDSVGGENAGSAYVFVRTCPTWIERAKLVPSDGEDWDFFGISVSLSESGVVVGADWDDIAGKTNAGSAYTFQLSPGTMTYCTAGTSASGCQAAITASGVASASAPCGFELMCANVEGAKDGGFFFGTNGQQAHPWGNGTSFQCVVPPVTRTGLINGVGTTGQCNGSFTRDLNAFWCPTCTFPTKNPGTGATVQAQLWYRDPLSTSNQTTSLSDAIEFVVGP